MARNGRKTRLGAERSSKIPLEATISRKAAQQFGRISRAQLVAIGISDDSISSRVSNGRLLRLGNGVYAVGHIGSGTDEERWATGLLAAGPGSLLSNLGAAAAWRMRLPAPAIVDITNSRRIGPTAGIRPFRREIDPREIRRLEGFR